MHTLKKRWSTLQQFSCCEIPVSIANLLSLHKRDSAPKVIHARMPQRKHSLHSSKSTVVVSSECFVNLPLGEQSAKDRI